MAEVVALWRGMPKEEGSSPAGVPKIDSAFSCQMAMASEKRTSQRCKQRALHENTGLTCNCTSHLAEGPLNGDQHGPMSLAVHKNQ